MKRFFLGIIIIFASWWTIKPLISAGYFPVHDDTQIARVVVMGKALRWGQFPVRWVSDLGYGYGYPIFNFYGPLPYYMGGFLYALGINGLISTKIMMATGMILAGITMFFLLHLRFAAAAAIVSSLAYVYAPYHAVQLYVRGAVGELWTLVFFPLVFYGLLSGKNRLIGSIGLAGVILSHTLLGYATVVLLILGLAVSRRHVSLLAIGLGLSAFFWLPAVFEMKFTNVAAQVSSTADFHDHFVCISQLWSSTWGFGGSVKGCLDGLSFMIGKLNIIFAAIAVLFALIRKKMNSIIPYLSITLIGIFLLLPISTKLWEIIPFFAYIQYPWRFLVYVLFGTSALIGFTVSVIQNRFVRLAVSGIFALVIISFYSKWFKPQYLILKNAGEYETREELRYRVSKISDEYMPSDFRKPTNESEYVRDTIDPTPGLTVAKTIETDLYSRFDLESQDEKVLTVRKAYFPGTKYWVNGKPEDPVITNGIPHISVGKGKSVFEIRFTDTPIRVVANVISLFTIIGIVYVYAKTTKKA